MTREISLWRTFARARFVALISHIHPHLPICLLVSEYTINNNLSPPSLPWLPQLSIPSLKSTLDAIYPSLLMFWEHSLGFAITSSALNHPFTIIGVCPCYLNVVCTFPASCVVCSGNAGRRAVGRSRKETYLLVALEPSHYGHGSGGR